MIHIFLSFISIEASIVYVQILKFVVNLKPKKMRTGGGKRKKRCEDWLFCTIGEECERKRGGCLP